MSKVKFLLVFVMFICIGSPVWGLEVVIDPGHDGNEQNRCGPAFSIDWLEDTLAIDRNIGDTWLLVENSSIFSIDTEPHDYSIIQLDMDTYQIKSIDYEGNILTLSDTLTQDYPAGTEVTVNDFLIQAMGRKDSGSPEDWAAHDTDFTEIRYSHEIPANEWEQWRRKTDGDGDKLGLLEFINTWRIASWIEEQV